MVINHLLNGMILQVSTRLQDKFPTSWAHSHQFEVLGEITCTYRGELSPVKRPFHSI